MGSDFVVKLRGLPFSATTDDIIEFLVPEVNIFNGPNGVHITEIRRGRPSGEAYVELESESDLQMALKKDKEHMGKRYIEVFGSDQQDMEWALNAMKGDNQNGGLPHLDYDTPVVKLRGLPFGCNKEEVVQFFDGLPVESVMLLMDGSGRASGEAFVVFADADSAAQALHKHKERMGHRYIEVFASDSEAVNRYSDRASGGGGRSSGGGRAAGGSGYGGRPAPYRINDRFQRDRPFRGGGGGGGSDWMGGGGGGRMGGMGGMGGGSAWGRGGGGGGMGGGGGFFVHMRGLPFKATQLDIANFFSPLRPMNVNILMDNTHRPSGEADVEFGSHEDAMQAMHRDKTNMDHRYIELFYGSGAGGAAGGGGSGGKGGRPARGAGYGRSNHRM